MELGNRCKLVWKTYNGTQGMEVTGPNGRAIFLPASGRRYGNELQSRGEVGFYWSGTRAGLSDMAYLLYLLPGYYATNFKFRFYWALAVRPVTK